MSERKICEAEEVLRLSGLCATWPNCRAAPKTSVHSTTGRYRRADMETRFEGFFCDCAPVEPKDWPRRVRRVNA